jgi:hypothetical protein
MTAVDFCFSPESAFFPQNRTRLCFFGKISQVGCLSSLLMCKLDGYPVFAYGSIDE